ncbi:MAG TPA: GNAT family N-acetyltransferase [Gemmatimonadales bacterium]|nr:GNAT family N-acetyltransferase [Gemmatimonadales bacterium]
MRTTRPEDIPALVALSAREYGGGASWQPAQLASHLAVFPEGQLVATLRDGGAEQVVGMASSLIIFWDDYDIRAAWRDFTAGGYFTNHDPAQGRTLYGAEIIVDPARRGHGIGARLYEARCALVQRLGLLRIRAGSRLAGYHVVADRMSAEEYVVEVVRERLHDPTLSFQLHHGFRVIGVVSGYLAHDPKSLGFAAIIEWLNERVATPTDRELQQTWAARWLTA